MTSNNPLKTVDHLFLLIGENPLPNYVAAKLLLNKKGTPYLVYTSGTGNQAIKLQEILNNENNFNPAEFVPLGENESDAYKIQEAICKKLEEIEDGEIGLHYTGGTKAMSVHSYRSLFYEKRSDGSYIKRPNIIFSYLDPRRLEMCIDREEGERDPVKVTPQMLEVKLEKLFEIHGLKLNNTPTKEPHLPNLAAKVAKIHQNEDTAKLWFKWFYDEFCKQARKKKANGSWGNWQSKTQLLNLLIPVDDLPQEIVEAFQQENILASDGKLSLQAVNQKAVFAKPEYFCKWLDGTWLEHYVLNQIKTIAAQNLIYDLGMNFEVPLTGTQDGFEFDIAFTRGYQLFAISCSTTADRGLCKLKLFEAYIRARQMGGAEARVALICCNDEPSTLKAEISATLEDSKIAVFGRSDLPDLTARIAEWIRNVDKEASK